ncbi:hypothetical protein GSI_09746 [Ganoderma sinense ZZ0214-1]|uniref:F-box domain-containing protein n=1 Tax=Ganoderma sinense ZZ0214-1 TaxID=1077348 RepID=A0A2G8S2U7_9APHY|nr:hypothetical protein GSI_09746 [Ganoderma sinense ZZ0214-1]
MSVLFSSCNVTVEEPINEGNFLPPYLWPYVRTLYLRDECPDLFAMTNPHRKLKFATDPLLCGTIPAQFLRDALRSMPLLRSVHLTACTLDMHGIGWDSIAAILSAPQLRSFTLGTYLLSPREAPSDRTCTDALAPITTFRFDQPDLHASLLDYPAQQDTLAFVLPRLHSFLESLFLPSEVAPVAVLSQTQWPRLREFSLTGEFDLSVGYPTPLASLFSGMSGLRILNLTLALPLGVSRKRLMLWPEGHESRLPWPDLESLTLSFPDPEDRIFAHLPPSLRRLSLRCTPHHCLRLWEYMEYYYYDSPILYSSEMLEILTKISAPLLDHLQLEYLVDSAEDDLLRCIVDKFPNVGFLEVQRFQTSLHESVPVATVAQRLSGLHSLHTLRAHLQPARSMPVRTTPRTMEEFSEIQRYYAERVAALYPVAAALGSILPQPGIRLWLLQREDCGATWKFFGLVNKTDVVPGTHVEHSPADGSRIKVCDFS